jgi:hypothetical protein
VTESPSPVSAVWSEPEPPPRRRSLVRQILGWLVLVVAVLALAGVVAGLWNPGRYVVLERYFSDTLLGAVVVLVLFVLWSWLLLPVRAEAQQNSRIVLRSVLIVPLVLSLIAFGLFHPRLVHTYRVVTQSPSGQLTVALRTSDGGEERELRVWRGHGLTARDTGSLGRPCGPFTATFRGEGSVHVSTVYGDFDLAIDPATGRPVTSIGPTCSG